LHHQLAKQEAATVEKQARSSCALGGASRRVALASDDDQRIRTVGLLVGAHGCDPDKRTAAGRISTPAVGTAQTSAQASTTATRTDRLSLPETE
jgi:hypothetical protein